MSGRNRRDKDRRHRRMEAGRNEVHNILKALENEKDEEKIKELHRELGYWSQYASRRANQL